MILFILAASCCGCSLKTTTSDDIDNYEKDISKNIYVNNNMPKLDSLGEYVSVQYRFKERSYYYSSYGYALFVKYDDETYQSKKSELLMRDDFLSDPVIDDEGNYIFPVTEFGYNGYDLKIIPGEEYAHNSCKAFNMLGFCDEHSTIAYLCYFNYSLAYIGHKHSSPRHAMLDFMDECFYWL